LEEGGCTWENKPENGKKRMGALEGIMKSGLGSKNAS
jgi:hypothetical protein